MKKYLIYALTALLIGGGAYGVFSAVNAAQHSSAKKAPVKAAAVQNPNVVTTVTPDELINDAQKYLNRNIKMNATFDKFSTLGLDYKPALRSSEDYIGILIRKSDITDYVMPLP